MLKTETRNCATEHIDKAATEQALRLIQAENQNAVNAVEGAIKQITAAVDAIFPRMQKGGRLFYTGCGTSGRLGVLDASECPPTFGVSSDLVVGIIAGGDGALRNAAEGAEDSAEKGAADVEKFNLTENDSVIGISAAGGAAYVLGSLKAAKAHGALAVGLTCNEQTPLQELADICIITDTGAEAITGSTRMKAGSAHKMVLNMISTSLMVKLGFVYENLMINLKPSNIKLKRRMIGIVSDLTGLGLSESEELLNSHGWSIRPAVESVKKL